MKRLALLSLAALAACAPTAQAPDFGPPQPFRAQDFAWSTASGANTVTGTVSYATPAGPYTCAGAGVGLTPETAYSRRRVASLYLTTERAAIPVEEVRGRVVEEAPADYNRFVRAGRCDAQGRFSFTGLPDGAWYVITQGRPATGQGPALAFMQRVVIRGGETRFIAL
jgi:hypothetical protein